MIETIAFIPDGNRRYAKKSGITLEKSYFLGTRKAWDVLKWMTKYKEIKNGIFYTFSLKNFKRNSTEKNILLKLFEKELDLMVKKERQDFLKENKIKIRFIGKKELFSKKMQNKMSFVEELTAKNGAKTIYLAIGYDGQEEIITAIKNYIKDIEEGKKNVADLNEKKFLNYLYLNVEPDLIVRTSPEKRLSGFLTFQSAYSEFAFIDKFWPEIEESDLKTVINAFEKRDRRFGK
jgi:undecaprenyl diphosphate synthase